MVRPSSPEDERVLLDALRRRDEAAFAELVRRYAGLTSNDTKAPWAWGPSRTSTHRRSEES